MLQKEHDFYPNLLRFLLSSKSNSIAVSWHWQDVFKCQTKKGGSVIFKQLREPFSLCSSFGNPLDDENFFGGVSLPSSCPYVVRKTLGNNSAFEDLRNKILHHMFVESKNYLPAENFLGDNPLLLLRILQTPPRCVHSTSSQATTFHPRKIPKLLQTVAQKVGDFLNSSTIDMALTRDLYKVLTPPCKQFSPWDWLIPYSMIIWSSIQAFEQNTKQIKIAACGVSSSCPRDNVCNKQPTTSCVCCKTWSEWVNLTKDFCAAWTLTWILGQIVSGVYNDGVRVKLHEQDVTLSL